MTVNITRAYELIKLLNKQQGECRVEEKQIFDELQSGNDDYVTDVNIFNSNLEKAMTAAIEKGDFEFSDEIVDLRTSAMNLQSTFDNFIETLDKLICEKKQSKPAR